MPAITNLSGAEKIMVRNGIDLGNVNNTSDLNKPISIATQAALDLKVTRSTSAITVTTSGALHEIAGIPATATEIKLYFDGISTTGANPIHAHAGTAASLAVTGYVDSAYFDSSGTEFASTIGIPLHNSAAGLAIRGTVTYVKVPGVNRWMISAEYRRAAGGGGHSCGIINLAAALSRVGISCDTADTFDLGSIWATWS